jgi:hypothetical protein
MVVVGAGVSAFFAFVFVSSMCLAGSSAVDWITNSRREYFSDQGFARDVIDRAKDVPARRGEFTEMTCRAVRCASFAPPRVASVPFQCLMQQSRSFVSGRAGEKSFGGFADQHVATVERGERLRCAMTGADRRRACKCCWSMLLHARLHAVDGATVQNFPFMLTTMKPPAVNWSRAAISAGLRMPLAAQASSMFTAAIKPP